MTVTLRGTGSVAITHGCAAETTSTETVLSGSELDARPWTSVTYTLTALVNAVKWAVYGANAADYSGELPVQALTTVTAGASGTYTNALAPFSYYRVKVKDNVDETHGSVLLYGKATA